MKRAPKFVLAGTPRQIETRLNELERQLERGARRLHARGARIERLIAKIQSKRAARKAITRLDLCDAVNSSEDDDVQYHIAKLAAKLAGVESYEGLRRDLTDQISHGPNPKDSPVPRPSGRPPAASLQVVVATSDPVEAAIEIVRNATDADLDIDWTREPRTDRERKIRAALIAKASTDTIPTLALGLLSSYVSFKTFASDITEAMNKARAAQDRKFADRRRQDALDAAREVDRW